MVSASSRTVRSISPSGTTRLTRPGDAPLTIQAVKRIMRELRSERPDVDACDALVRKCFASADYREGRRAFMEKRKPVFNGS